jgi:hypothetical protein
MTKKSGIVSVVDALTHVVVVGIASTKKVKRNCPDLIGTRCLPSLPLIYLLITGCVTLAQLVAKIAKPDAKTAEIDNPFNKLKNNLLLIIDMSLSEYLLFQKLFLDLQHQ